MGARRRDVLLQFLIESGTMALIGGLMGVAGGIAIAKGVTAGHRNALGDQALGGGCRADRGGECGNFLRRVSRAQGGKAGPDCGVEV